MEIINDEAFECYPAVLVNCASFLDCGYELMFICDWYFDYIPYMDSHKTFGERIITKSKYSFLYILDYYYGLTINQINMNDINRLIEFTKIESKKGMPLILFTDTYWCKWCNFYKKIHFQHVILIISINEKDQFFECMDPYFSNKVEKVYFEEISEKFWACCIIDYKPKQKKEISLIEFMEVVTRLLHVDENNTSFNKMRMFACDFKNYFNILEEIKDNQSLYKTELFEKIKKLKKGRLSFIKTLIYVGEHFDDRFLKFAEDMKDSINLWDKLSKVLIKMSLKNSTNLEAGYKIILEIILIEENIYENMKNILKNEREGINENK